MIISPFSIVLPVTVTSGRSASPKRSYVQFTETFSSRYRNVISDRLLKELAVGFISLDGKCASNFRTGNKVISVFCERFSNKITNLEEVTPSQLEDLLTYLKLIFPTKDKIKKEHPWLHYYNSFLKCFKNTIGIEKWPYVGSVNPGNTDGHTPYAMKLMLVGLKGEVDRIRGKKGRWEEDTTNGRILSNEDIDTYINRLKYSLTEKQLDDLALDLDPKRFQARAVLAKKWKVTPSTISVWWNSVQTGKHNNGAKLSASHRSQRAYKLGDFIPPPQRMSNKQLSEKYGITQDVLRKYREKFQKGLRPQTNTEVLKFSRADVVATICYYLPGWPMIGRTNSSRITYRCYDTPSLIFKAEFNNEADAIEYADKFCGVVRESCLNKKKIDAINPGEKLLMGFNCRTFLGKYLQKLLPGGVEDIYNLYFPTTYDWTCILLYWCCKTGWNQEVSRSVSVFQLTQVMKGNSALAAFSSEHVSIRGEKKRSNPEDNPAIFTHVCDLSDKYGLYMVLKDYYEFSRLLRPYLKGDEINCILVGISNKTKTGLSMYGTSESCCSAPFADPGPVSEFFRRNPIFEYEGESVRIETTDSRKLRTTYESVLEFMGIPLMLRSFILGHKSYDTTTTFYGSDIVSSKLQIEKLRENLVTLSEKAFKGELKRYEQVQIERSGKVLQIFTHMGNDIFVCWNCAKPSWEGHDVWLKGKLCEEFSQCLLCKQACVTEDTLPYLVRWQWDIEEWKKVAGFADFPVFMFRRYQAIREVIEMCLKDDYWQHVLDNAQDRALDEDFYVPPIWSAI